MTTEDLELSEEDLKILKKIIEAQKSLSWGGRVVKNFMLWVGGILTSLLLLKQFLGDKLW